MTENGTPSEGSPPPPPPPPESQSPPPASYYQPKQSIFERLSSQKILAFLIVFGLLFVMLGAILVHAAPFITNYGRNVPKDSNGNVDNAKMADDQAAQNSMTYTGHIFNDLGMFFLVLAFLLAAFMRTDLSDTIRFGLLLAIGLIFLGSGI